MGPNGKHCYLVHCNEPLINIHHQCPRQAQCLASRRGIVAAVTSPGEVHASEVVLGPLLKCGFNPESRIPSGAEWEAVAKTTSTPAERQHEMGTRALRLTALHPCCQFLHCMCSSGIQECHSDASAPAGGIWGSSDLR